MYHMLVGMITGIRPRNARLSTLEALHFIVKQKFHMAVGTITGITHGPVIMWALG